MHVKNVIVKTVIFIPKRKALGTQIIHRIGNKEEMLPEFTGHVFVCIVLDR